MFESSSEPQLLLLQQLRDGVTQCLCHAIRIGCTNNSSSNSDVLMEAQQQQQQQQFHRALQNGTGGGNGTLAILIIVSILFCLVWTPTLFRRCGFPSYRDRLEAEQQAESEAIRAVLQSGEHVLPDFVTAAVAASPLHHHHHSLDDRRDYIRNVLVTKRVRKADPTKEGDEQQQQQQSFKTMKERPKSDLYITTPTATTTAAAAAKSPPDGGGGDIEEGGKSPITTTTNTTTTTQPAKKEEQDTEAHHNDDGVEDPSEDSGEACPICLTEYSEGDEICWSHNRSCNHVFHRECILEWLLRHDDCPCCRHNFLSLDDNSPVDEQSWGHTNLFWNPLRIPPLPRIDADEEEFWNRIHEFRHFARRYLNGPYPPNNHSASGINGYGGYGGGGYGSDFPPSYLSGTGARPYSANGLSIFQLEDPSPSYSLAIGRPARYVYTGGSTIGGGAAGSAAAAAGIGSNRSVDLETATTSGSASVATGAAASITSSLAVLHGASAATARPNNNNNNNDADDTSSDASSDHSGGDRDDPHGSRVDPPGRVCETRRRTNNNNNNEAHDDDDEDVEEGARMSTETTDHHNDDDSRNDEARVTSSRESGMTSNDAADVEVSSYEPSRRAMVTSSNESSPPHVALHVDPERSPTAAMPPQAPSVACAGSAQKPDTEAHAADTDDDDDDNNCNDKSKRRHVEARALPDV